MTTETAAAFQSIALPLLRASSTNPRKTFDKAKLEELAASVLEHGILQPILVRPLGNLDGVASHDCFEIVAGERRFRAAKLAKLAEVPATVRDLTDKQVVEIQVIENVQREDLHPLEEAEGYEQLVKHHGYDVKAIAAKIGKSDSYVSKRLVLCKLGEKVRKAYHDGKIDLQRAFLLARIPHEDVQVNALKAITPQWGDMSLERAAEIIRSQFMLRLKDAPFDTKDAALCPAAGACVTCPKRTGAAPELFPDVKKDDLCTDSKCFDEKRAAHRVRTCEEAKAKGWTILSDAEAKKAKPHAYGGLNGYVLPDQKCFDDVKQRTYAALLGKDAPTPVLINDPHGSDMLKAYALADVKKILKDKHPKLVQVRRDTHTGDNYRAQQTAKEKKAKAERGIRMKILEAVHAKVASRDFDHADLIMIAQSSYDRALFDGQAQIAKLWNWTDKRSDVRECKKRIAALSLPELRQVLVDMALINDTQVSSYSISPPTSLLAAAKRYKVDAERIRREAAAAAKAKPKAKGKK